MKQTCGNCKWGKYKRFTNHKTPRTIPFSMGTCEYQIPAMPILPRWVTIDVDSRYVAENYSNCPTWESKQ